MGTDENIEKYLSQYQQKTVKNDKAKQSKIGSIISVFKKAPVRDEDELEQNFMNSMQNHIERRNTKMNHAEGRRTINI